MGNKCNPQILRLGTTGWKSIWCSNNLDYKKHLIDDQVIRKTIESLVEKDLIADIKIKRAIKSTTDEGGNRNCDILINISTNRPGVVIGKEGVLIQKIKATLEKKFPYGKISLDVSEVYKPEINARLIASSIAKKIAERKNYRKSVNTAIAVAMKSRAEGIKVVVSGRLNGSNIGRSETFSKGSVPLASLRNSIFYWAEQSHTVYGVCGVSVYVNLGEVNNVSTV